MQFLGFATEFLSSCVICVEQGQHDCKWQFMCAVGSAAAAAFAAAAATTAIATLCPLLQLKRQWRPA